MHASGGVGDRAEAVDEDRDDLVFVGWALDDLPGDSRSDALAATGVARRDDVADSLDRLRSGAGLAPDATRAELVLTRPPRRTRGGSAGGSWGTVATGTVGSTVLPTVLGG